MPDKAIISHRGEKYEIGRGKRFYGIWTVGAPYDAPVDRWPENPTGWQQAWARFATIESPGTIVAVPRERKARSWLKGPGGGLPRPRGHLPLFAGEGLLVLGVALGLAGLFPAYFASQGQASQSLLSQPDQVVAHLCYVLGWAVSAALIALSVARPATARLGALFGLGLGVVTFGLFLADLGQVTQAGVSAGSGLVVSLLGWLACTAGSAVALAIKPPDDQPAPAGGPAAAGQYAPFAKPARRQRKHAGPLALLVLAALGTAAAFFPSWDRYTLVASATGQTQTITEGNAFTSHYPGLVVAGDVAVMVAIVVIAALAALWRPPRQGALLLAGAIVPLAAQAASALIQVSQPVTPALFGISAAQAQAAGLSISAGVTAIYWVFFVFVISLLVSCAWLFTEPGHQAMPAFTGYGWPPAGPGAPAATEDTPSDYSVTEGSSAGSESEAGEPKANEEEADSAAAPDGGGQSAYA